MLKTLVHTLKVISIAVLPAQGKYRIEDSGLRTFASGGRRDDRGAGHSRLPLAGDAALLQTVHRRCRHLGRRPRLHLHVHAPSPIHWQQRCVASSLSNSLYFILFYTLQWFSLLRSNRV